MQVDTTLTSSYTDDHPTGLLSSTVDTFINDGTTSEYVTFVHGTKHSGQYAQVTSTSSRVFFAVPTRLLGSQPEGLVSSEVQTQVNNAATTRYRTNYVRTHIDGTYAELIKTVTDIHLPISSSPTAAISIPIHGTFTETVGSQNAKLEVSLVDGLLNPQPVDNKVVTLMGTKGQFIKDGPLQPTTYNVFTGSYVNNHRTYLFFFGNTALPVVSETHGESLATQVLPQEVVLKKGGDQSKIIVDMEKDLKVIMPSKVHTIDSTVAPDLLMGEGMINGHLMEGVFIESSEGFEMQGAKSESLETSMVTITIGRPNSHTRVVKATSVADAEEVTVLSMEEKLHEMDDINNEIDSSIPFARKVRLTGEEIIADLRPSETQKVDLPTFTIKQGNETLEKVVGIKKNVQKSVETSISQSNSEQSRRDGKSLDDIRARFNLESGDIDSDLPTVTYVGFADFTTTIADTVVVFTPRSQSPNKFHKSEVSKTKSTQHHKSFIPSFSTLTPTFSTLAPRIVPSENTDVNNALHTQHKESTSGKISVNTGEKIGESTEKPSEFYSTVVTHRYNSIDLYPTGLVSSIGGTIVKDDMTTLLTTYVYGTYINGQYAQVVESTSSIFYLVSRSATVDIQSSKPLDIMFTTQSPEFTEATTEFYNVYDYDYEGDAVTEDLVPFVEEVADNNIGRSVASSPGQQMIIDTKDKKEEPIEASATLPSEDYSVSTLTSYLTYFRDGQTTISTILDTSTIFLPLLETQKSSAHIPPAEEVTPSSVTSSTYLTTLTYYTTLFVDGVTKVSSRLQVYTKTAGNFEIKPTSSATASVSSSVSLLNGVAVIDSIAYDDYDFTTQSVTESFTESISESMSEFSTESSAQDVTESPGLPLDSSLNAQEDVNAVFFPRTYYTTFTYFTTYYRSDTSTIVSSLETLTNVVTDVSEHDQHKSLTSPVPTYPVTYYTTYTYWTTYFKGNETLSVSTEETLSRISTPAAVLSTTSPDVVLPATSSSTQSTSKIQSTPAVTTFYTTFTYYTSTYLQDSTIVNSRLETITNVVSAGETQETVENTGTISDETAPKSTGLLSTIRGSTVIDGTTTIFSTNIIGTIIDGLYAQIQSTTSEVILPSTSTPFFIFPVTTTKPTSDDVPFFIFPATTDADSPTSTVESIDSLFPIESEEITTHQPLLVTPSLDSSISETTTEVEATAPTEALPEIEATTNQPIEEEISLITTTERKGILQSTLPSGTRHWSHKPTTNRPDIFDYLRRTSTITRDGTTPTVTATPASKSSKVAPKTSTRPFRFGFISSSGVRSSPPSSSLHFRFQSSRFDINSRPTTSSRFKQGSSSIFRFDSSGSKPPGITSTSGGFRFASATSSVFPAGRKSISPSSVIPKLASTISPASGVDKDEDSFDGPGTSLRPFSFRKSNTPGTRSSVPFVPGTRSSVPFAIFNRRTPNSPVSDEEHKSSRFDVSDSKTPFKALAITTEKEPEQPTTEAPKNPLRLSLEERRQNRFRQSRPNLSKLFARRNPFKKDLNNEATELEPVYVEADGRLLTHDELEAILAEEILSRRKRQAASEFGVRTTSRGNTRFNRQSSNTESARTTSRRGSRQTARELSPTPPRRNSGSQFTLSNNQERSQKSNRQSARRSVTRTSLPQRPSRTRNGVPLGNIRGRGFRRPSTDNSFRTSNKFSPTRPTSSPIRRPRPTSSNTRMTSRRPTSSRNQETNPIAKFRNRPAPEIPTEPPKIFPSDDGGFLIQDELTITREVPVKATIPLVEDGKTIQKEVITASFQTEVVQPDQITQTDIDGAVKLLLSTIDGGNEITHYIIEPKETTTATFTKTFVGGRRTSVEHILPTTAYNLVTVTKSKGGNDLQQLLQLLLGQQQQQQNPLLAALGLGQQASSEIIHTRSYVTTVTSMLSTVIPVIFRGKTIETTVVDEDVKVVTATELSTETIFAPASISPFQNTGPLNQLLPLLLQGQLQQQSPQIRPTREPSIDTQTVNPQLLEQLIIQQQKQKESNNRDLPKQADKNKPAPSRPKPTPAPVETSIVTLYVSGRRPGEFSTLLSTVTLGDEATRIKRGSLHTKNVEATVLPHYIETDKGIFQLPDSYDSSDMDWYIMSAMNEIDTSDINKITPSLESVIGTISAPQNGTHTFNANPFLWVGPAEIAPLKRTVRSAQRGSIGGNSQNLSNPSRARKIQDGNAQQLVEEGKQRPVLGQFNVPGLRFQSRLISEQVQNLQPPTTFYTTFTYYTTLVDEIGHEFVESSEETITQIATNGNVRFDDFTRTADVPLHTRFTLDDAIIPGKPRPVPDPVFPEPLPPHGPVVKHFDGVQPFQPVPQPFVPEEFQLQTEQATDQHDLPLGLTTSRINPAQKPSSSRRAPQNRTPNSPQLILHPSRNKEEESLALSQPRRVVLTRKRPVQLAENHPRRVVKNRRPVKHLSDTASAVNQKLTNDNDRGTDEETLNQNIDIQREVTSKDTDDSGKTAGENSRKNTQEEVRLSPGSRRRIRVTVTSRRPVSPSHTTNDKDRIPASTTVGRKKVIVSRRLPQPTVTASRLHPLVATVNTYYTVYSYLYTLYEGSSPFSVSTREVTVSNQIEPTVVSVLPKFQTGNSCSRILYFGNGRQYSNTW